MDISVGNSATAGSTSQKQYRQTLRDAIDAYEKEHGKQIVGEKRRTQRFKKPAYNDRSAVASDKGKIHNLPNELVELIFTHLDDIDLGHMRLMCRKFAVLAAPSLFKDGFSIKPHRQDMIRLARVCLSPALAVGIKDILVYMGDMNKHQFFNALHACQQDGAEIPVEPVNRMFDKFSDHLDTELLSACFSQLPSVDTITTYSEESPFLEEADRIDDVLRGMPSLKNIEGMMSLNAAWAFMHDDSTRFERRHFLNTEVSAQRTFNLMLALQHLPKKSVSVNVSSLPLDVFAKDFQHLKRDFNVDAMPPIAVDVEKLQALQDAVKYVEGFEVGFEGSGIQDVIYTGAPLARAITEVVGSMRHLKRLTIEWQPEEEYDVDFASTFDQSFFKLRFPQLEELRLADLCSVRGVVLSFILGHAPTVSKLAWSPNYTEGTEDGIDELWQTESIMATEDYQSWRDIFTEIRERMTKLVAVDISDVESPEILYAEGWQSVPVDPRHRISIPKLLEYFVLGKVPWPMKHDNPKPYRGWKAKHTTTNQEFDAYSTETLAELYSDEWETDKEDGEGHSDSDGTDSEDEDYGADDDDMEMDDFYDDEFDDFMEGEGADDFDFAQMNHAMQAMIPGVFGFGPPGHDDEWEDEDDDDEDVDMDDEDMPHAVDMDALGGEIGPARLASLMAAAAGGGPVGTGIPGRRGMPIAEFKAALGYESDPDER